MGSAEHKQKIWEMIKEIGVGMLVTEDRSEHRGRPMQLVQDNYEGTLWFFTKLEAHKTAEVQDERNVCITFSDPGRNTYVSMTGNARLNFDQNMIDKFWSPFVAAWYPEGKKSTNVGLLEIKINHGEHWDSDTSKLGFLYEVAKANITGTKPDLGENQKF